MLIKKKIIKKYNEFKTHYKNINFYNGNEEIIYINLKNRTKVRTYLNLIIRIRQSSSLPIVFNFNPLFIFVMSKWLSRFDNLYIQKPFSKLNTFWSFSHSNQSTFKVKYNYKKVVTNSEYIENALPYIMHPEHYLIEQNDLQNKKYIGILFSGNFNKEIYGLPYMNEKFGIQNRFDILNEVKKSSFYVEENGKSFVKNLESEIYLNKIVHMKHQNGAIQISEWLKYLSYSKFIFCAPGMTMPLCHNVLEAMSVGVVPILNYQNWLNPSLVDSENCLVYSNLNSIDNIIRKAINMSENEYEELRKNVIEYYKKYYENFDFNLSASKDLILLNENKNDLE